jgi:hydrogenase expression/formation protein HypE
MQQHITLDHGSGGLASQELLFKYLLPFLNNSVLNELEDSAVISIGETKLAFTTDSYVVDPIFFPGGDIARLAVNGTLNDLAMKGASPVCLSLGLILEEGLRFEEFERLSRSLAEAAEAAGIQVVTGDTKVVPHGKGDKIFINTSGIGVIHCEPVPSYHRIQPGDCILVSGTVGDHGITILTSRSGLKLETSTTSDTMPLHRLVAALLEEVKSGLHCMRDPTRGGLATTLTELAGRSGWDFEIDEEAIPIHSSVASACEILGFDPLYLANEGKCVVFVAPEHAEKTLQLMRSRHEGVSAAIIGRVMPEKNGRVILNTTIGGKRLLRPLTGEPLPRIC